jgi:hypothetical protein
MHNRSVTRSLAVCSIIGGLAAASGAGMAVISALAQQPVAPAPPSVYTLTAEQKLVLNRALQTADFWLKVRAAAAANSVEGHAYELAQQELAGLANALAQQDQAAAAKAAATSPAALPGTVPPQ